MNRSLTSSVNASMGRSGLLFYLVPVAFYLAYADTFKELWFYWNEVQNWQFLIPLAFVYMLWDRRDLFLQLEIRPNILWGSLLLVFSIAILIAGQISYTHTLRELSVVFAVFSLVLLLFGPQYIRKLFWPLVYLFLMLMFFFRQIHFFRFSSKILKIRRYSSTQEEGSTKPWFSTG